MLAPKLLELARFVGVSQYSIAVHFGVNRSHVNHWARGKAPVPARHREALIDFVLTAARRFWEEHALLAEASQPVYTPPLPGSVRDRVETLVRECIAEDLEERGEGPTMAIPQLLQEMHRYQEMCPDDLIIHAAEFDVCVDQLKLQSARLRRLGRLTHYLEESTSDHRQRESGSGTPVMRRASSTHATPDSVLAPARHRRVS